MHVLLLLYLLQEFFQTFHRRQETFRFLPFFGHHLWRSFRYKAFVSQFDLCPLQFLFCLSQVLAYAAALLFQVHHARQGQENANALYHCAHGLSWFFTRFGDGQLLEASRDIMCQLASKTAAGQVLRRIAGSFAQGYVFSLTVRISVCTHHGAMASSTACERKRPPQAKVPAQWFLLMGQVCQISSVINGM